jgi:multimeric flavodoxin WrbA
VKSFFERVTFPYLSYDASQPSLFQKKLSTGFIYTMGADENRMKEMQIDRHIAINEMIMGQDLRRGGIAGRHEHVPVRRLFEVRQHT